MDAKVDFLIGCFPNATESKIKETLNVENISGNVDLAVDMLLNHPKSDNCAFSSCSSSRNATETFLVNFQKKERGREVVKNGPDVCVERPCLSLKVDKDIMGVVMSSYCSSLPLQAKLNQLQAEFEWNRGSSTATAWRRGHSTCFHTWSEECKRVVSAFLGRYEKTVVQRPLSRAVTRELARLEEGIPEGGKLLVNFKGNKRVLSLICLKSDTVALSTMLRKSIRAIEEDEICVTKEMSRVESVCHEHLVLLEQAGFEKELVVKYPELKLTLDLKQEELRFTGPSSCVAEAALKYDETMSQLMEGLISLPSSCSGYFITKRAVQRYIREKLVKKKIPAIFFLEKDEVVKIVAVNLLEYNRAKDCLVQTIKKVKVPLLQENYAVLKSEKWKQLFDTIREQELLEVCVDEWSGAFILYGIPEVVNNTKEEIVNFIESEMIQKISKKISRGVALFLKKHMSDELEVIERQLMDSRVHIKIDQITGIVHINGKRDGIQPCLDLISRLCFNIATKSVDFSSPGNSRLISSDKGRRHLKMSEMANKLVVTTNVRQAPYGINATNIIKMLPGQRPTGTQEVVSKTVGFQSSDSTEVKCVDELQDSCAKRGIKLFFKYGDIANEKADILVNSATPNLNAPSACGLALNRVGGPPFADACKPHTSIKTGSIVCTSGGNLACCQVLHVVCCKWDGGQGMAEKLLCCIISQILRKCVELTAKSIAMPVIGSGNLTFPRKVVFKALKKEVEKLSSTGTLNEIRIIIYEPNLTNEVTSEPAADSARTSAASTIVSPRVWSSMLVDVTLLTCDITKCRVDAIVNTLPSDLKLCNGDDTCKRILQAGGKAVQNEVDFSNGNSSGSVIRTSAGKMTNTRSLLHVVPSSTDSSGLQRLVEECFDIAKTRSLSSIAIPVLQTSLVQVSCKRSAELMVNAVESFSRSCYPLKVFIFVPGKEIIDHFESVLQERTRGKGVPVSALETIRSPSSYSTRQTICASLNPHREVPATSSVFGVLSTGQSTEVARLHFISSSQQYIDTALEEMNKFVKEQTVTKKIERENIWHVLMKNSTQVATLLRVYDVSITWQTPATVSVEGEVICVSDCKEKLWQLVNKHVEDERKVNQRKFITKNVQWQYFFGGKAVPYGKEINAVVEEAYMENKASVSFDKDGVGRCEIDFMAMNESNITAGNFEKRTKVARTHLGNKNTGIYLPTHWLPQDKSPLVRVISLKPDSSEYGKARMLFDKREGKYNRIIKIERIQNPGLYKAYFVKKQTMQGDHNEMQLFHGTKEDNVKWINANNFNRRYAGINGVAYGEGVYFARSASYSLSYSRPSSNHHRYMYIAKVLVGKYTAGKKGLKTPPSRNDPENPGLLYDSVVDKISYPSIFVVFVDHQCYPEYLITFT